MRVLVLVCALSASARAAHTFDLASQLPPKLAIMFAVNWFGLPSSDPGGGSDPGYGNWKWQAPACGLTNDPSTCTMFAGSLQRSIASRRRPLAGIYSSTGRDDESKARIDLMLSTLRRPCDAGGRFDAFAIQLDSIMFTSAHPSNMQSDTWDIAYRALTAFLDRASKASLSNAVAVASDATVYWHFGDGFGLTTQDQRKAALQADIAEMAKLAAPPAALHASNGQPILVFYVDGALMTPAEWQAVLDGARAQSGVDFYALATTLDGKFFTAFDALAPWVNLGLWTSATGATTRARAADWATKEHASLLAAANGGRVVFGAVAPGFDDYTENWGACMMREIPRDPQLIAGQFDVLQQNQLTHLVLETWDDWTEGTEFEPDVAEGTQKLISLRRAIGVLFGESATDGEQALTARWAGFGQARNCCFAGGPCDGGVSPVDPSCPALDMAAVDGGIEFPEPPPPPSHGCGCSLAPRPAPFGLWFLIAAFAIRTSLAPRSRSCRR
jgi:hypothetical protein